MWTDLRNKHDLNTEDSIMETKATGTESSTKDSASLEKITLLKDLGCFQLRYRTASTDLLVQPFLLSLSEQLHFHCCHHFLQMHHDQ